MNRNEPASYRWESFAARAESFLQKTQEHVLQGMNPGGVYQAVWCRDASYILKDWFLSGNIHGALQQIFLIWSHQISPSKEKLVYGRGSPEMKFLSEVTNAEKEKEFEGALPTTIYQAGFSEVYGQNPDIDSTALMISTTSWILARALRSDKDDRSLVGDQSARQSTTAAQKSTDYVSAMLYEVGITDPAKVVEYVVPRMSRAIDYLASRDKDKDGLLEQNHNEDWMDTVLRAGKIVYSQACWLLALNDFSILLQILGRDSEASRLIHLSENTISAVEQKLWSESDRAYVDIQETHHIGGPYRTLTQDVSFYLVAISQNTAHDGLVSEFQRKKEPRQELKRINENLHSRAIATLESMRTRLWKEKWPLVTEVELKATGPWILKPYQYHNQTFWPWTTGIEMLARSRFDLVEQCDSLLFKLALASEGQPYIHAFYEWVNPLTDQGEGAFPFRTGITAVRIAIADIFSKIKK
jgi:glycogen debranching enzyme